MQISFTKSKLWSDFFLSSIIYFIKFYLYTYWLRLYILNFYSINDFLNLKCIHFLKIKFHIKNKRIKKNKTLSCKSSLLGKLLWLILHLEIFYNNYIVDLFKLIIFDFHSSTTQFGTIYFLIILFLLLLFLS